MTDKKVLKALVFCMDSAMSTISDDEQYNEMVDLQNELKEELGEE